MIAKLLGDNEKMVLEVYSHIVEEKENTRDVIEKSSSNYRQITDFMISKTSITDNYRHLIPSYSTKISINKNSSFPYKIRKTAVFHLLRLRRLELPTT